MAMPNIGACVHVCKHTQTHTQTHAQTHASTYTQKQRSGWVVGGGGVTATFIKGTK